MEWIRGDTIGCGSFGTVNLVKQKQSNCSVPPMAVKSADSYGTSFLQKEKQILDQIGDFPQIIRCFGDDYSSEGGERLYNVFLELASRGSLADLMKKNGGVLGEAAVRRYSREILKGLRHVHAKGFAHLDIKLQNILVFENGDVKIADFGLAKRTGEEQGVQQSGCRALIRGTPLYMAPESVNENEYESPADIWALGCGIVEMITGKPAWDFDHGMNVMSLLIRIGCGDQLPEIPAELSDEGKDFLRKIFVKDPSERWTAEMLLRHPFVGGEETAKSELSHYYSPRGPFDFPDCISSGQPTPSSHSTFPATPSSFSSSLLPSVTDRIHQLFTDQDTDWSVSDSWITVR